MEFITLSSIGQEIPIVCGGGYDENLPPGITYGPVIRDVYIVSCTTSGHGSVIINGRTFPIKTGDCYMLLPGDTVMHTASVEDPRGGVWCALDGRQIGRALAQAGITSENPYLPQHLFGEIEKLIKMMVGMLEATDPGAELRKTGCIYNMLGILLRDSKIQANNRADWLNRVMGYIGTYYNEQISVTDFAKVANLERSYFSVRFKQETGMTPHNYLESLRIRKACELMKRTECTVAEAAELVGLDSRNFSRIFKKRTGLTPSQYIKNHCE